MQHGNGRRRFVWARLPLREGRRGKKRRLADVRLAVAVSAATGWPERAGAGTRRRRHLLCLAGRAASRSMRSGGTAAAAYRRARWTWRGKE
eukprot:scaffold25172_cov33-Tisochrysis_lutea.AAC.2